MIKTENLTILFVDIAGFTATTSRQSRAQNARLLQTFGSTLLPLIKYYKGRLIKTIGDALLLTFRSPTDAMLCSMALQDAMHAHNLSAPDDEKIHIRVAANLGEVRVTKNDIFGEPVNIASRIEGVAPADEIYLSEAVYMAMNKAEVPCAEVGFTELKGVSQAVRLYNIPRFSTPRLVAENTGADEEGSELLYPYGGMHYHARPGRVLEFFHFHDHNRIPPFLIPAGAVLVAISAVIIGYNFFHNMNIATPPEEKNAPVQTTEKMPPVAVEKPTALSPKAAETVISNTPAASVKEASAPGKAQTKKPVAESAPAEETEEESTDITSIESTTGKTSGKAAASVPGSGWDVTSAKEAYRASKISKTEYSQIIYKLKSDYKRKITRLKQDYRSGKITRDEYEKEARQAKQDYAGR